jgi:ABC-type transporter Mla subunit MlaD
VLRDDKDNIKHLLSNSANAVAEANQLLVDNRTKIGELIGNGADLAKEAKTTLTKLNAGLGDGRPVASLVADADRTLRTAQSTMTTLTPSAQALMTDATRVTGIITEQRIDKAIDAADKAASAAGKAGGLIDNVNGMVTDLRAGKGTAGALLARDEVYSDLRELIRDLKRNPWKLFWKE